MSNNRSVENENKLKIRVVDGSTQPRSGAVMSANCSSAPVSNIERGDEFIRIIGGQSNQPRVSGGDQSLNRRSTRALDQMRRGEMNEYEDLDELFEG